MNHHASSKIWLIIILVIVVAGGFLIYQKTTTIKAQIAGTNPWSFIPVEGNKMIIHEGELGSVEYKKGTKIQVSGFNLGKVEFWATPTDGRQNILIGTAIKREKMSSEEKGESWLFVFPSDQTMSHLQAIAFDSKGNEVGRINFPYFENINTKEAEKVTNWKIYRNKEYGYEIKYSPLYNAINELNQAKEVTIGSSVMPYYGVSVRENIGSLEDLKSLMEKSIKKDAPQNLEITWEDTTVSGRSAIEMSYKNFAGGYTGITHQIGVMKDTTAYIVRLINGSEKEYYQMLSTFNIIE